MRVIDGSREKGMGTESEEQGDRESYFTDEERRLYDEAHAPMRDRMRRAIADAWLPLVCVGIIAVSVVLMVVMRYSGSLLVILSVALVVLMMGSIIYIMYKEQSEANALADKAERIYKAAMEMKNGQEKPDR